MTDRLSPTAFDRLAAAVRSKDLSTQEWLLGHLRGRSTDPWIVVVDAMLHQGRGDARAGLGHLHLATRLNGEEGRLATMIARLAEDLGAPDMAHSLWFEAAFGSRPYPDALLALINRAIRRGDEGLALAVARHALRRPGDLPERTRFGIAAGLRPYLPTLIWSLPDEAGLRIEGMVPAPGPVRVRLRWGDQQKQVMIRTSSRFFRFPVAWPDGALCLQLDSELGEILGGVLRRPRPALTLPPARDGAPVAIIIPVYRDPASLVACVRSVLAAPVRTPFEIILVDDASPEPAMAETLAMLAGEGPVRLIRHAQNLGFVGAANSGIAASGGGDVLLLNSDTLVHGDWLDRLMAAARAEPRAASLTPLSNSGAQMSFPRPRRDAPMPDRDELARLDDMAARVNAGIAVDIPFGVGFCWLLRRACLDEIGLLDEAGVERGYGEEGDFSLRASARGWRHLCVPSVFVAHQGAVSFGSEKADLVAANRRILQRRHPRFDALAARLGRQDPVRPARARIDRARLESRSGPVLAILRDDGDGPAAWQQERREWARAGQAVAMLRITPGPAGWSARLSEEGSEGIDNLTYRLPTDLAQLTADLTRLAPISMALFDAASLPRAILELPVQIARPHDLWLEDEGLYCPRQRPSQPGRGWCGDPPGEAECTACIARFGALGVIERDPSSLRRFAGSLLAGARRVLVAGEGLGDRYRRRYPGIPITVVPAPARPVPTRSGAGTDDNSAGFAPGIIILDGQDVVGGYADILPFAAALRRRRADCRVLLAQPSLDDLRLLRSAMVQPLRGIAPGEEAGTAKRLGVGCAVTLSPMPAASDHPARLAGRMGVPFLSRASDDADIMTTDALAEACLRLTAEAA